MFKCKTALVDIENSTANEILEYIGNFSKRNNQQATIGIKGRHNRQNGEI